MIDYIINHIKNTKISIKSTDYKENEDKIKSNYRNENEIDFRNFEVIDFKDVDLDNINLKIIFNNIFLSFFCLVKNLDLKNIANIVEFDKMQFILVVNLVITIIDTKFLPNVAN